MKTSPLHVTNPSLAPLEEFIEILKPAWESGVLTHNGPLVQKLEIDLCNALNVNHFACVTNGTIALQLAIKALDLRGEIIVPAFTWIASVSAIKWENCTPVFCDIDKKTLNIDTNKIEQLITDKTVGIMPVHVFGTPCDVYKIQRIAEKHNLKIIYDAAHALGSTVDSQSVLSFGDISATSLHATKLLNSGEGGGCITNNVNLHERLKRIRFFGHSEDKSDIIEDGLNAKMTEVHAALGLANLKYFKNVLEDRKEKYRFYQNQLCSIKNISFQSQNIGESNCSYFPIIFESEKELLEVVEKLNSLNIFPRRYFYPSVNTFSKILSYKSCPISEEISKKIICLPLFKNLKNEDINLICNQIIEYFH